MQDNPLKNNELNCEYNLNLNSYTSVLKYYKYIKIANIFLASYVFIFGCVRKYLFSVFHSYY